VPSPCSTVHSKCGADGLVVISLHPIMDMTLCKGACGRKDGFEVGRPLTTTASVVISLRPCAVMSP
jgi:hypothetical protein